MRVYIYIVIVFSKCPYADIPAQLPFTTSSSGASALDLHWKLVVVRNQDCASKITTRIWRGLQGDMGYAEARIRKLVEEG